VWIRGSLVLVLGGVVACGGRAPSAVEAPAPAPAPAATVEPAEAPAPAVHSLTVVASGPRSDWPCRIEVLAGKVQQLEVSFTYDGPATCLVPVDVLADGVIGCPTRMTRTGRHGGGVQETILRYDDANHLVAVADRGGTWTYAWDGDTLLSASNPHARGLAPSYRYVEVDGAVELQRDTERGPEAEFLLRFEADRLVEIDLPAFERRDTLVWEGERIQQIVREGTDDYRELQTPRYDCQ
jgi:YD repeat-containing protein